jgi:gamma-glutamylcyclotransferase
MHYFAYGSNLHPQRLSARLGECPLVGPAVLTGYRLAFHKRGRDESAKCDIVATGKSVDAVFGAVFRLASEQVSLLDEFEGAGYRRETLAVRIDGMEGTLTAVAYQAHAEYVDVRLRPFEWYRDLVLAGAHHHGFPEAYIAAINSIPAVPDPDPERDRRNRDVLVIP